jgi:LAO/AO transport system kinase
MALKTRLSVDEYAHGIQSGNRVILAKAITMVESNLDSDQKQSAELFEKIIHLTGKSVRIGITGVPGVGKSTFIEAFGKHLIDLGKKIAVLTIDPSSSITHGSILGDKTRMETLSKNPHAFIRPTASGNTLGGVASSTREAMLLCEAAGYDVILVETVGVGQSEVAVKNMVDFFLLLMLAGAGDELQGIKKGIMEMADAIVITKADGDNVRKATEARADYQHALHLFPPSESGWITKVLTCSAHSQTGIAETWNMVEDFQTLTQPSGHFIENRKQQSIAWLHEYFNGLLLRDFQKQPALQKEKINLEKQVADQKLSPQAAAHLLLDAYHKSLIVNS